MASAKTVLSGSEGVATLPVEHAAITLTEFDQRRYLRLINARGKTIRTVIAELNAVLRLATALDAGCGVGFFAQILQECGLRVGAFDGRLENVLEARKRFPGNASRFPGLAPRLARTRRGLAARTKMAAAPRNNHAANLFPATDARLSFPLVNTMAELELAPVSVGVDIIRNGGAAQTNCGRKNPADRLVQRCKLSSREVSPDARWMNSRAK